MKTHALVAGLLLATASFGFAVPMPQEEAAEAPSAAERFRELSAEYDAVLETWSAELRAKVEAAREAGEELPDSAYVSPAGEYLPRFQAGADEYAGSAGAAPYLVWIVNHGSRVDQAVARASFAQLAAQHPSSEALEPLVRMLPYMDMFLGDVDDALRTLVETSTLEAVREAARFGLYSSLLGKAASGTPEHDEALAGMKAIIETLEDERLKDVARRKVKIAESFATGMVAPDIDGLDLDGVAFKLSDYKGKIVFLDFWGDW